MGVTMNATQLLIIPLLLTVFCAGKITQAEETAFSLVHDGESPYVIVLREDSTLVEQTAANELQQYLAKTTGVTLPIISEADHDGQPAIYIGPGKKFQTAFPDADLEELDADGIFLRTLGDSLFLCGGKSRGTLYAVYTFLEDVVGCRWWTSTEEYVPHRTTLDVPKLDITYTPTLRYRELWYRDSFEGIFASRLRLNGFHHPVPESYGGHYNILGFVHTFYPLLPPEQYFDQHPEWYSEINGERVWQHAQLCLTNDEMRKALTEKALERLRAMPEAGYISISQNDWYGRCECADCLAVEEVEGAPSGPLIRFVNAVAEDIEKEFPDTLVETLAYQYTRQAPKHVKPRHNVLVRLCSIECSFSEPLTAEVNTDFRQDIEAWKEISPQLFVWDYVANFASYIQPHPNWFVLAPNIRFFVENNVRGLFEQGDGGSSVGDFLAMRAWILSKLLWNPEQDFETLLMEFLTGYYGPAAQPLREYMDVIHEAVRRNNLFMRCYVHQTDDWLSLDDLNQATALMNQAETAVLDDAVLHERVIKARMPLEHVWLLRYYPLEREAQLAGKEFLGPEDPVAAVESFIANAERFNNQEYREAMRFEHYAPQLRARFRAPGEAPEACRELDESDYYVITDSLFSLFRPGELVTTVEDPAASDGKAARMPGTHSEWAIQYTIGQEIAEMGAVHCRIEVRADDAESEDTNLPVLQAGIYDTNIQQNVVVLEVPCEDIVGTEYREIDLGVHNLASGMYFWVAPAGGASAVYVDRIYVMKSN